MQVVLLPSRGFLARAASGAGAGPSGEAAVRFAHGVTRVSKGAAGSSEDREIKRRKSGVESSVSRF